jgi:chromatin segregation and condensation protein Rec8/ScpA/Scc1 (kleisin family)
MHIIIVVLCFSCNNKSNNDVKYSFYYWKSSVALTEKEKDILTHSSTIYVRYFDIYWNNKPIPVAKVCFANSTFKNLIVVPVIYIKNEVFVNISEKEIESLSNKTLELIDKINNTIDEVKASVQNEVNRAVEVENGILNQIDDIRNQLENTKVSDNVAELIEAEKNRALDVESKIDISIKDIRASLENETNRSIDAVNTMDSTINEIKTSVQNEVNRATEEESSIKQSIEELRELIQNNGSSEGTSEAVDSEKERALAAEKELKDKIDALYQYFFKSTTIPN